MANIHLLLLAAGASSRMKEPKQLLSWNNTTLIEHQLENLIETNCKVSVVLGAKSSEIQKVISNLTVSIYTNENWKKGMGTSIAFGVQQILKKDVSIDGILISLIDQPLLTSKHFNKMIHHFQQDKKQIIVSKSENGWSGAPVLFDKLYFKELINLKGDEGAKAIISKNKNIVESIAGNTILEDIDTPFKYQLLLKQINNINPKT